MTLVRGEKKRGNKIKVGKKTHVSSLDTLTTWLQAVYTKLSEHRWIAGSTVHSFSDDTVRPRYKS